MATTFADLEGRSSRGRHHRDHIGTVSETLTRVKRLERGMEAIAGHLGVTMPPVEDDDADLDDDL